MKVKKYIQFIKESTSYDYGCVMVEVQWQMEKKYTLKYSNLTDGGEGTFGYRHTEKTKKVIREKRSKQTFSIRTK